MQLEVALEDADGVEGENEDDTARSLEEDPEAEEGSRSIQRKPAVADDEGVDAGEVARAADKRRCIALIPSSSIANASPEADDETERMRVGDGDGDGNSS